MIDWRGSVPLPTMNHLPLLMSKINSDMCASCLDYFHCCSARVKQAKEKHQKYDGWSNEYMVFILILVLIDIKEYFFFFLTTLVWDCLRVQMEFKEVISGKPFKPLSSKSLTCAWYKSSFICFYFDLSSLLSFLLVLHIDCCSLLETLLYCHAILCSLVSNMVN